MGYDTHQEAIDAVAVARLDEDVSDCADGHQDKERRLTFHSVRCDRFNEHYEPRKDIDGFDDDDDNHHHDGGHRDGR